MSKKCTTEKELRKNNLKQYIADKYDKQTDFYKVLKHSLTKRSRLTSEQADGKVKQLQGVMRGDDGRTFTEQLQKIVEKAFSLPKNILSQNRSKRSLAYIFISCTGQSANLLFSKIQENKIVDEISLLFGDIDVFIKVYGTSEEIQKLITEDLYKIEGLEINNTKTYFTLSGKSWVKHPVSSHPNYNPPEDRWE